MEGRKPQMTLSNMNVVITGGLRKMDRWDAYKLIEQEGGCPKDNMSNIVNILVIADEKQGKETGKIRKARLNKQIKIISENEFYSLVGA